MRVIQDHQGHAAIELDPESRLLLRLGDENSLVLQEHPETWFEIIEQIGRVEYQYAKFWHTLTLASGEPYPAHEAMRKMMRGAVSEPTLFGPGVLEAVMENLPHGDYPLFTAELGFLGRYCCPEDAQMIARAHRVKPIALFSNLDEFLRLPVDQQTQVALAVGATIPKKFTHKLLKEVFDMSSKAARKKAKNETKRITGKQKPGPDRSDGPVARAKAIFAKMPKAPTSEILDACEKAGVKRSTATTQLGWWRKENGIIVTRGPKKVAKKAEKKPAPATKKKAASAPNPAAKPVRVRKSRKKTSAPESGSTSQPGQSEIPTADNIPAASVESSEQQP